MYIFKYIFSSLLFVLLMGACSSNNTRYIVEDGKAIVSIEITPHDVSVPKGTVGNYIAIAYLDDGSTDDVTDRVIWNSAMQSVVEFSDTLNGEATALSVGTSTITATIEDIVSNSATVEVTAAVLKSITIDPVESSVAKGIEVTYSVTGIYSDATHSDLTSFTSFQSSDESVATVDNLGAEKGIVQTLKVGSTNITATLEEMRSNTAVLNVTNATVTSLQVTPAKVSVPNGTTGSYVALVYLNDGSSYDVTEQVNWESEDESVASVRTGSSQAGYAEALKVGNTSIKASYGNLMSNIASVEVTDKTLVSININPIIKSVPNGIDVEYRATGIYSDSSSYDLTLIANFTSSDESVALVNSRGLNAGLATTLKVGTTKISATFNSITSGEATLNVTQAVMESIQVTPANESVNVGEHGYYKAVAYYSDSYSEDITKFVVWTSENSSVVSILSGTSSGGYASALKIGTTTIKASSNGVVSNSANIAVVAKEIKNVQITPNNKSFVVGEIEQYYVYVIYEDLTSKDVTEFAQIQSSNFSVTTFDTNNLMTAVGVGTAELSAVYEGVVSEREFLHVSEPTLTSIQVSPSNVLVPIGTKGRFSATAYYNNNTSADVTDIATWISSAPNVVSIVSLGSNGGLGDALASGTSNITATLNTITSNQALVTVSAPVLDYIHIVPATTQSIAKGLTYQFEAYAVYDDLTQKNITYDVTWSSSNSSIATIETNNAIAGLAYGDAVGTTEISAVYQGSTTSSVTLNVVAATLSTLEISPKDFNATLGQIIQYSAIATYSDNATEIVTSEVTWSVEDTSVVSIVPSGVDGGQCEALTLGDTTVSATLDGVDSNIANISVKGIILDSITIDPVEANTTVGGTRWYQATATYSDGSTMRLQNEDLTWRSLDTSKLTITQDAFAQGVSLGDVNIEVVEIDSAKSATGLVHVIDSCGLIDDIVSVHVVPDVITMSVGEDVQFVMFGVWSNGCEEDVSRLPGAVWTSSDDKVIRVQSAGNSAGFGTAKRIGIATVTGKYKGDSVEELATADVTVE